MVNGELRAQITTFERRCGNLESTNQRDLEAAASLLAEKNMRLQHLTQKLTHVRWQKAYLKVKLCRVFRTSIHSKAYGNKLRTGMPGSSIPLSWMVVRNSIKERVVMLEDGSLPDEQTLKRETCSDEETIESTDSNSASVSPRDIADTVSRNTAPSDLHVTEPVTGFPPQPQTNRPSTQVCDDDTSDEHSMENQAQGYPDNRHSMGQRHSLSSCDQKLFSENTAQDSLVNASVTRACDSDVNPWYRQGVKTVAVTVAWLLIGIMSALLSVGDCRCVY